MGCALSLQGQRVHSSLKSQSSPGPGWRQKGGCDLLAGSVLQLPQTARLSLGLVQARVLAGRGGVWQVLAWRRRAAGRPLGGGIGQVGIHQLHDLFHLREGRGQRVVGATGFSFVSSSTQALHHGLPRAAPATFPSSPPRSPSFAMCQSHLGLSASLRCCCHLWAFPPAVSSTWNAVPPDLPGASLNVPSSIPS